MDDTSEHLVPIEQEVVGNYGISQYIPSVTNWTYYIQSITDYWTLCNTWDNPQHWLFQAANLLLFIAYVIPTSRHGLVYMHFILVIGLLLYTTWAWNIACAADICSWNLVFLFINIYQLINIMYQMRSVKFDSELEEAYYNLFRPFKVTRLQFKKLVTEPVGQVLSLQAGQAYAMQNITRNDRLGLLLSGRVNVLQNQQILHPIESYEFLDSPEYQVRNEDEKFKVTIVATTPSRYITWKKASLANLFTEEPYLGTVISMLVSADIAKKLYAVGNELRTKKGFGNDIRVLSIQSALVRWKKSPIKRIANKAKISSESFTTPHESITNSEEKLVLKKCSSLRTMKAPEMQSVPEMYSIDDDMASLSDVSNYHSCEFIEA